MRMWLTGVALRDTRQIAVGVALRRQDPLQVAHASAQSRVRLRLLDLGHVLRELTAVARHESGTVVDLEAARLGEDAGQAGPDRLRRDRALEDVFVIEDDAIRGSDVLTHRLVIGVHHDLGEAPLLYVLNTLVEVLRLVPRARAGEHHDAVPRRGRDDLREALASEEEAGRYEDELVHGQAESLTQRALLGVALRQRRVLERHEDERKALELAWIVAQERHPAVGPFRMGRDVHRDRA